jgi:hypothetical protein
MPDKMWRQAVFSHVFVARMQSLMASGSLAQVRSSMLRSFHFTDDSFMFKTWVIWFVMLCI